MAISGFVLSVSVSRLSLPQNEKTFREKDIEKGEYWVRKKLRWNNSEKNYVYEGDCGKVD